MWTNPNLKQTRLVHMAKERVGGGREEGKETGKKGERGETERDTEKQKPWLRHA